MSIIVFSGTDIWPLRQRDAFLAECVRLGGFEFGTVKFHLPLPHGKGFIACRREYEVNILNEEGQIHIFGG